MDITGKTKKTVFYVDNDKVSIDGHQYRRLTSDEAQTIERLGTHLSKICEENIIVCKHCPVGDICKGAV